MRRASSVKMNCRGLFPYGGQFHRKRVAARREIARERVERGRTRVFKARYVALGHAEDGSNRGLLEFAPFLRIKHGRLDGADASLQRLVESGDFAHFGQCGGILSEEGAFCGSYLVAIDFFGKCIRCWMCVEERLGLFPERNAVRDGFTGGFDETACHGSDLQLTNDGVGVADLRQGCFLRLLEEAVENVDDVADAVAVKDAVLVVRFLESKFKKVFVDFLGLRGLHASALAEFVDKQKDFGHNGYGLREDEVVRLLGEDDLLSVRFGLVLLFHVQTPFRIRDSGYVITNDNHPSMADNVKLKGHQR